MFTSFRVGSLAFVAAVAVNLVIAAGLHVRADPERAAATLAADAMASKTHAAAAAGPVL